jgi:hypothetical protein
MKSYNVYIYVKIGTIKRWEFWLNGLWPDKSAAEYDIMRMGLPKGSTRFKVTQER